MFKSLRIAVVMGVVIVFLMLQIGVLNSASSNPKSTSAKKDAVKSKAEVQGLGFEVKEFPDGLIGRRYNFVLAPTNAATPFKINLTGKLPSGLTFNQRTGGIEGEPTQVGVWKITLNVSDAKGKKGTFVGDIRVWRMLTVGEHGTFKGFDGIQMALNVAKDMDEIRIEQGTYEGTGLLTPKNKMWEHGIKISGGWNETFDVINKGATVLNGGQGGGRILIIENSNVSLENLTFKNSADGAIKIAKEGAIFNNCIFTNNSAGQAGAVDGYGTFINCTFTNNSATYSGAVRGGGTFKKCIFTNNSGGYRGGAVDGNGIFTECTFTNNSALRGGAVYCNYGGSFTNCVFINNSTTGDGGAVYNEYGSKEAIFTKCIFKNNSGRAVYGVKLSFTDCTFADNEEGAVYVDDKGSFISCTFTNNRASKGGAVSGEGIFINCIFTNNSARYTGGAVDGKGIFVNCSFYGNKAENGGGALQGNGSINNCIFYKNTVGGKDNDIAASDILDIDYSLIAYISGAANYGANNIMGDPKFVNADKGDLHLRSDSPCINTGRVLPPPKKYISLDLDGNPRVVGGKIDMGAYESQGK